MKLQERLLQQVLLKLAMLEGQSQTSFRAVVHINDVTNMASKPGPGVVINSTGNQPAGFQTNQVCI